ncbi:hypothetical protein HanIR_Chr10g0478541 [Helianthus annuus]|nr:hypothetical protein HanIR_Chr10g0478541 [Helianthus annuus]
MMSLRQQMEIKNGGLGSVAVKHLFDDQNEYNTQSEDVVKLITAVANKHRKRILEEAYQFAGINRKK